MFLDAAFGAWAGTSVLADALAQNDSSVIMDALMMRNDSLVTIILMGAFIAMFMTSIPTLIKTLFSVSISDSFYKTTKDNMDKTWANVQKIYKVLKK
jgi:tetrahydromethanopterin S-methyltransferase subunit D